jgi:3-oxoacyl-(acyl-carrier-protein) synthase
LAAEVEADVPRVDGDRSAGLAVMAAEQALRETPFAVPAHRVGIIVGSAGAGTSVLERALLDVASMPSDWWRCYQKRSLADGIARTLGVDGPRTVINTACSSSAMAIALGVD